SESIQELRDEMRRDVRGLTTAIERRPKEKPGVSPLAFVAGVLGALFVGAAGMSVYDSKAQAIAESEAPQPDVRADLQTAMSPYMKQLDELTQSLAATRQAATEDSNAHGLLLDRLAETVTSLQKSAEAQSTAFHERVDLLTEEFSTKLGRVASADGEPTLAARPPIPGREESVVQPASAETEITHADDGLVAVEKPPTDPTTDEPEHGELVISNPSEYELKLLINGEPMTIQANGATTIDVTVGTVKTQIASLPDLVQNWDEWETVDGVKRLTINVESGGGYYKLR
ncbi:MAG TPA: hypothetical protein VMM76_22965, partial [Pirellulaceae bacterium]|nr:hypothetical protein [Pirellulaceae bacterium]